MGFLKVDKAIKNIWIWCLLVFFVYPAERNHIRFDGISTSSSSLKVRCLVNIFLIPFNDISLIFIKKRKTKKKRRIGIPSGRRFNPIWVQILRSLLDLLF